MDYQMFIDTIDDSGIWDSSDDDSVYEPSSDLDELTDDDLFDEDQLDLNDLETPRSGSGDGIPTSACE